MKIARSSDVWLVDESYGGAPRVRAMTLASAVDYENDGSQVFTTEAEALECAIAIIEAMRTKKNAEADEATAYLNGRLRELGVAKGDQQVAT